MSEAKHCSSRNRVVCNGIIALTLSSVHVL